MTIDRAASICVVGAGPAGLATAYRLSKEGYANVTVLEKEKEIGGLCRTIEHDGREFDLGANYVTSAYRRIRAMAKEVGAELYIETDASFYDRTMASYQSILKVARGETGLFRFGYDCVRYLYKRWRLERELPSSGYADMDLYPDLMCSFGEWLDREGLSSLRTLFEIPITLMGYGPLDTIPAPYALTYMSVPSVIDLMIFGAGKVHFWPRRFVNGFQNFWKKVVDTENLDVITDVRIESVTRRPESVTVRAKMPAAQGHETKELTFDWIVLCSPLQLKVTHEFLDLTEPEHKLFSKIFINPFCVATYDLAPNSKKLKTRLVNLTPVPARSSLKPTIITQQFEDNPLVTFYVPSNTSEEVCEGPAKTHVRELANQLGITLDDEAVTYNNFPYFPQIKLKDFESGWYRKLEGLQGHNRTFYNGGIMAFELIEPIVEYSDHLVARHFTGSIK